ncbi:hypothetical protein D3C81_753590 [compost metagenome]
MLGYLNRKLGNISVGAKLALGFAVVLLLTLATTVSGWRALDDAIVRSQQLSEIGLINDLTKDLRAERITYRVLNDNASRTRIANILDQLNSMLSTLQQRSSADEPRQMLTEKLALLQPCATAQRPCSTWLAPCAHPAARRAAGQVPRQPG